MNIVEQIIVVVLFVLAIICIVISVLQFLEKGFLFNNAYIWADRTQREMLNKKPYYRQSAIVFLLIALIFIVLGMSIVLQDERIELLEIPLLVGAILYAALSTIKIEKDGNSIG